MWLISDTYGIISWCRLWENTATCTPYKRYLDKELHGTYPLDGNHQQHSGRRAMTYCPGETGPNPYSDSGAPH